MSGIPTEMPYDEEFMFFGVKGKDMTRVELLQVIKHLSTDVAHYKKAAENASDELQTNMLPPLRVGGRMTWRRHK
jgi:hypothetical protein